MEGGIGGIFNPKGKSFNLFNMPGIVPDADIAAGKGLFAPVEMGQRAQNLGDFTGQFGYFHALRNQSYTVAQADTLVKQAFMTGDGLSQFEKSPLLQASHLRQGPPYQPTPTRWPVCQPVTLEPSLSIFSTTS